MAKEMTEQVQPRALLEAKLVAADSPERFPIFRRGLAR
jgi:hypothetical protein